MLEMNSIVPGGVQLHLKAKVYLFQVATLDSAAVISSPGNNLLLLLLPPRSLLKKSDFEMRLLCSLDTMDRSDGE